jgi:selenocysteine lyase/cysteine desulfurase
LAADGHKWLLGPEGAALMFVDRAIMDRVLPSTVGWTSVRSWNDFSARALVWREDARRFEAGSLNTAGIYGLGAALSLLLEVGIDAISERILNLTTQLRIGLLDEGHWVFGPLDRSEASGIVSFVPRQGQAAGAAARLAAHRVQVSERCGKVRIAPHFYNTEEEIARVLDLLS